MPASGPGGGRDGGSKTAMSTTRKHLDAVRWRGHVWLVLTIAATAFPAQTAESTNRSLAAEWDATFRATAGGGYRDNVLGTAIRPESSGFEEVSGDVSVMRFSESGSYLSLFLLGEDRRYFNSPSVPKEQVFSSTVQFQQPVGAGHSFGAQVQYLYQFNVVDASETEQDLQRVLVTGNSFGFRPNWKYEFRPGWMVQLEGLMYRQLFADDLDDFWEGAARASLIHGYGRKSEWYLGYQLKNRYYDTRLQYDDAAEPVSGTSLVYQQHEIGGQWRHYWDEGRHWRTITRAAVMLNRDNGSGYFNYDRVQFSQQLRWANRGWDVRAQARFGWYFYSAQYIGNALRNRSYYALDARVERWLAKHWFLYAIAGKEWNFSNDPLDDYRDWIAGAGVGAEF